MTLHWWMHWFWVTSLLLLVCSSRAYPHPEELQQHMTTGVEPHNQPPDTFRLGEKRGKAMYTQGKAAPSTTLRNPTESPSKLYLESLSDRKVIEKPASLPENKHLDVRVGHLNYSESPTNTTMNTPSTPLNQSVLNDSLYLNNTSTVTSIPFNINNTTPETSTEVSANATTAVNETAAKGRDNLTRDELTAVIPKSSDIPMEVEEHQDSYSKITEKPLSLEAALLENSPSIGGISASRPRSLSRAEGLGHGSDGMDTGAIAGISFAALALAGLAGSTAFVLYRRRYLNKPQTLNDKCSNPDSSGYLDDSTIRENSEEMYSLDNDSFLNSLEAMTIQNYWTDSVKHTKL